MRWAKVLQLAKKMAAAGQADKFGGGDIVLYVVQGLKVKWYKPTPSTVQQPAPGPQLEPSVQTEVEEPPVTPDRTPRRQIPPPTTQRVGECVEEQVMIWHGEVCSAAPTQTPSEEVCGREAVARPVAKSGFVPIVPAPGAAALIGAIAPSLVDTLAGAENARLTSAATRRGESESGGVVVVGVHEHKTIKRHTRTVAIFIRSAGKHRLWRFPGIGFGLGFFSEQSCVLFVKQRL